MSVIVVGCNHRSADLPLLERVAVPADELPTVLKSLIGLEHVVEAAVLSTCNRVEVYAEVARFHPGLAELRGWFADRAGLAPEDFDRHHYAYYDGRAAAHLFAVAGGLDSMVVGEQQILLQVRQSMEAARERGSARRTLQRLFRQAVRTGRRVRRETAVTDGASSMVDVGLRVAAGHLDGGLAGRDVLIVGAGELGGLTADRLAAAEVASVAVWNRSLEKASRLAARVDGEVVVDTDLTAAVAASDLVVTTTGAPQAVIDVATVRAATDGRDRPLVLLDLGMPRNVEPACARLAGVTVIDIGTVREVCHDTTATGEVVIDAQRIVDEEAERFLSWMRAREVDPTIRAMRAHAESIRRRELERLAGKLATLEPREREVVEALTNGILNTLLHQPTVRLKELADQGSAEHHASALRDLFDLDDA